MRKSFSFSFIILYILLILYQLASSLYSFLPVLLGVYFCYLQVLLEERDKSLIDLDYRWYFAIVYVLFIELNHNYYAFSAILAFLIFHFYFAQWAKTNLKIGRLVIVAFVFCAYAFTYLVDALFSYMGHESYKVFGLEYLLFILIESIIVYILFKDKL